MGTKSSKPAAPTPAAAPAGDFNFEQSGGKDRSMMLLMTDKPVYRPGDYVDISGIALNAFSRKLTTTTLSGDVKVTGPSGDVVVTLPVGTSEGVFSIRWQIPDAQSGGDYTITCKLGDQSGVMCPPGRRTFNIRSFRSPRLNTQMEFVRRGYGAGDLVTAILQAKRAEGGVPAGAKATATAVVDGVTVFYETFTIASDGTCSISFKLPDAIDKGQGSLSVAIDDGGLIETTTRTIPILLKSVDMTFFPESGSLVFGAEGRVYVQAFTPYGDPADITAELLCEGETEPVATVSTKHEGRGVSTVFVPVEDKKYRIHITQPSGIDDVPLPSECVVHNSATIIAAKEVFDAEDEVAFQVSLPQSSTVNYQAQLYQREEMLTSVDVPAVPSGHSGAFTTSLKLQAPVSACGVLRIALVADKQQVVERLIFRRPAHPLKIEVTSDKENYIPGDDVTLNFKVTDQKGAPVQSVLCVTVSDETVRELLETRKQPPRLPVIAWLENEVETLEDAGVYLSSDPLADTAVDLLLGVQGWRLLAYNNVQEFIKQHKDQARRALAVSEFEPPRPMFFGGGMPRVLAAGAPMMKFAVRRGGPQPELEVQMAAPAMDMMMMEAAVPMAMPAAAPPGTPPPTPAAAAVAPAPVAPPVQAAAPPPPPPAPAPAVDMPVPPPAVAAPAAARAERKRADIPQKMKKMMMPPRDGFAPPPPPPMGRRMPIVTLTSYTHERAPDFQLGVRKDFTETVFWNAALRTDEKGEASCKFALNDAVTSFRVMTDGVASVSTLPQGSIGSHDLLLRSTQPFYTEPKLPLEVTAGDEAQIAVSFANATKHSMSCRAELATSHNAVQLETATQADLQPESRTRSYVPMTVGSGQGTASVTISATADAVGGDVTINDSVTRDFDIMPPGFPIRVAFSGVLKADSKVSHTFDIPDTMIANSVCTTTSIFPNVRGTLLEAVKGLIREPYGCFEQTSSSTYPLVMALQYINANGGAPPSLIADIKEKLEKGYKRLTGYETKQKGYEWFGDSPGHEALTAYGLMEFKDMSEVFEVDEEMIKRTNRWLNSRRDGKGGFVRNSKALDSFGRAPQRLTDAYILWAMTEAGETDVHKEVEALKKALKDSTDPYELALLCLVLYNTNAADEAVAISRSLADKLAADGSMPGAKTSITSSGGVALLIETTSLWMLGAMRNEHGMRDRVDKAAQWLLSNCDGGRFGSTQSTILTLKAIVKYEQARATPQCAGSVSATMGDFTSGTSFDDTKTGTMDLDTFADHVKPGTKNTIELAMDKGSDMNYAITITYTAQKPDTSPDCVLQLDVGLSALHVLEGETVDVQVKLRNTSETSSQPLTVAIIGLPGGLEPRIKKLQELREAGTISYYELRGSREVVLYWRGLEVGQLVDLTFDAVAAVPGKYTAPASRAYLYYTDELKYWVPPLKLAIAAQKQ